ncbi:hypothetical protein [Klebsiella pneumoniae]|uniref:hypothetical protein n=1 Tax=Klebsiella pneumoniae TaxID=573 RepID=UPI003F9271CB
MLTLNKTKAALQSCQCHYEKPKQIKHTRVNAGGQRMSQRNSAPADFIQPFGSIPCPLILFSLLAQYLSFGGLPGLIPSSNLRG